MIALAAYRFRSTISYRWRGYAAVAVLLGLTVGLALFAIAGARRTQSSYPRFLRWGDASTLSMTSGGIDVDIEEAVARFPEVVRTRSYVAFETRVIVDGRPDFTQFFEPSGTFNGQYFDQDRFGATQGRLPDPRRVDEVAVNEFAAKSYGYHVGQRLELGTYSPEQLDLPTFRTEPPAPELRTRATIVGIGLFPDEVVQDDGDRTTRMLLTPAFSRSARDYALYQLQSVVLKHGDADVDVVKQRYNRLVPADTSTFRVRSTDTFHAQQAVRPLSIALGLFGLVAGLTGLALSAQALTRLLRLDRDEVAALRTLGAPPAALVQTMIVGPALVIIGGTVLAVVLAVAASPIMPIGPMRAVEPSGGIDVDWTVVLVGAAVVVVGLLGVILAVVRHELPHRMASALGPSRRPSRIVTAAAAAGMPPAAVAGLRFGFEPGDTATAVPVRSVIPSAAIALAALAASITFGASLHSLVNRPALYGWAWDVAVLDGNGYGNLQLDEARTVLGGDGRVARWSGAYFGSGTIDGRDVPLLGMGPASDVIPPIVEGRAVAGPGEIVLGSETAAQLDKGVGDTVRVRGSGRPRVVKVVGTAILPTIGIVHGAHTSLGVGAMVVPQLVPGVDRDITNTVKGSFGPNSIFVRLRPGTRASAVTADLKKAMAPAADFGGVDVLPVQRPAEIVNSSAVGTAPALLAGALALGAMVSLGSALGASVRRRRRDLALLKTLGFTRRQVAASVRWQATGTIVAGALIGVPLGLALGRELWFRFARQLDVVPSATVPLIGLCAVTILAVVVANVAAAVPARSARRVLPSIRGTAE